jgi:putative endonuclease
MFYVYILQCSDGSYYVGSTQDVLSRVTVHNSGKGPSFTAKRLPVFLVYQESFLTLNEAVHRERQLKGWTHAKKDALISGDRERLRALSKSHQGSDASHSSLQD